MAKLVSVMQSVHRIVKIATQHWQLFALALIIMTIQLLALNNVSDQLQNQRFFVAEVADGSASMSVAQTPATSTRRTLSRRKVWYASAKGSECLRAQRYRGKIPLPLVALLSTQGSGNTWLRWLIECLTGICTGSLYKELIMRQAAFQCEMLPLNSGRAIAYKVHYHHQLQNASAVILLVRNPFDVLVSDYNRMNTRGNHTALADADVFRTAEWRHFVRERSKEWLDQILTALQRSPQILVVFYENLKTDLSKELVRLADFLGIRVNDFRVKCVIENSMGVAKREKRTLANLFNLAERHFVADLVVQAHNALEKYKIENIPTFYKHASAAK